MRKDPWKDPISTKSGIIGIIYSYLLYFQSTFFR